MSRPKIKIPLAPIDVFFEVIGILGLILLFSLPVLYYNELPETIPSHYGAGGKPDGFSGKEIIWASPIIGFLLYLGLYWINRYPHRFNYPGEVTARNAERLYKNASRMMRILNAFISCTFAFTTYTTIQTALGNQNGLGSYFLPVFLILIFGITGTFLFKSTQTKK